MTSMDLSKTTSGISSENNDSMNCKTLSNIKMAYHYGLSKIKDNKKIIIIITILHMICMPVILLSIMLNLSTSNNDGPNTAFAVIGVTSTIIAGLAGILIAVSNFNYLYKKSNVDMILSLPLTYKSRFLADFISGFVSYVVPFIAVQLLSCIMFLIGHICFDGKEIIKIANNKFIECTIFADFFPMFIKMALGGLFVMLFLYILTVFVISCCGNLFETVFYTFAVNGLIPAVVSVICFAVCDNLYGIDLETTAFNIISCTSPAGCAVGLFNYVSDNGLYMFSFNAFFSWFLPSAIIIVALFFASYFLGKHRKAEQVGKPVVYKFFYYFIITSITFCIVCLCMYSAEGNSESFINKYSPIIIISGIAYLILEVINNRGFKKFWKSIIRYVVTFVCVSGLYVAIMLTGGFGAETRVPDVNSVRNVQISGYTDFFDADNFDDFCYTSDDKENIKLVADAHSKIISNYKEYRRVTYNDSKELIKLRTQGNLEIIYTLNNGQRISRKYKQLSLDENDSLKGLVFSEKFREYYIDEKINYIKNNYTVYINNEDSKTKGTSNPTFFYSNFPKKRAILTSVRESDKEFFDSLIYAYEKDLREETKEQYFYTSEPDVGTLWFAYSGFCIRPYYKNTINFLKAYISEEETIVDNSLPDYYDLSLLSYDDYMKISAIDYVRPVMPIYGVYNKNYITNINSDVIKLLEVSTDKYITTDKCYTIMVNSELRVIPAKYNDIAERVYSTVSDEKPDELTYQFD